MLGVHLGQHESVGERSSKSVDGPRAGVLLPGNGQDCEVLGLLYLEEAAPFYQAALL
jgi:hypothetical protein